MASGWWDDDGAIAGCVAAYAPVGAADLASSYVNLANPGTYNAAPGVAPTWNALTGWTFNGSTQYLTTGVVPASDQSWSMIVRFTTSDTDACVCGSRISTNRFWLYCADGFNQRYYGNGFNKSYAGRVTSGVMAIGGNVAYLNGSPETGTIAAGSGTNTHGIYIGCLNNAGTISSSFSGTIVAFAVYSSTLSASDVATITTRMNALPEASGSALPILLAQHAMMG